MNESCQTIPLSDQGLIRASGEEAAAFLNNLLTNDIAHLAVGTARYAGLCTPKGRLIASFLIWREDGDYYLQLSADILPAILKKLSMYVLRSKVKLTDVSSERALLGVIGGNMGPDAPMTSAVFEDGTIIRLDAGRSVLAIPADRASSIPGAPGSLPDWHRVEIAAGIPRITAATQELFTPQMVNYELPAVGGVSFQKGCYPGQEVVARTQYLGKVKRRMFRARLSQPVAAGADVFTPEAGDQHCGAVVLSTPADGDHECLLVVQISGAEANAVHVGTPDGPRAEILALPYTVD